LSLSTVTLTPSNKVGSPLNSTERPLPGVLQALLANTSILLVLVALAISLVVLVLEFKSRSLEESEAVKIASETYS
jgi:hypothetical protein